MIQGILAVLGLCFFTGSHQMNYQQALTLSRITNITQLFSEAQINRNGIRIENVYEVLPYFGYSGEQQYVGPGFPDLAMPDECSPRLTTVEIPRDGIEDANVLLWPRCTRIRRCGGCCANNMLRCIPEIISPRPITILRAKLWDSNDPNLNMDWEGMMQVELEEHVKCTIVCSITEADCNNKQRFEPFDCSCRCRMTRRCSPLQRWDLETCSCVCKDPDRVCMRGTSFDPSTCRCRIDRSDQRYSNLNVDGEETQNEISESSTVEDTTSVPTTTPTTSTTASSTVDPCASQFCPPMFNKVPNGNGGCVCTPSFTFPGK